MRHQGSLSTACLAKRITHITRLCGQPWIPVDPPRTRRAEQLHRPDIVRKGAACGVEVHLVRRRPAPRFVTQLRQPLQRRSGLGVIRLLQAITSAPGTLPVATTLFAWLFNELGYWPEI